MSIKVHLRDSSSEVSILTSDFKEVMHIEYLSEMHFLSSKVKSVVQKRCQAAYMRGKLSQKQLWMGCYFSREIQEEKMPDISIVWINEKMGYGVWTNRDIPPFTYIGKYTGILRRPYFFKDRSNYYCFNYCITMNFWEKNIWTPYLIDAEKSGNFTRYINHSAQPNLDMTSAYHGGMLHIIFFSKYFIPRGTQFGYDYGPIYWEKRSAPLPLSNRFLA